MTHKATIAPYILVALLGATNCLAQPSPQPPSASARTIKLALAVQAAQTAISTCQGNSFRTAAIVANVAGSPIATLGGDGTSARLQQIVATKVATVARYKVPSADIARRVAVDPAFAEEIKADPTIGTARAGGLPIMVSGEMVGIIAVGGAPRSDDDTTCAQAGIDAIAGQLR